MKALVKVSDIQPYAQQFYDMIQREGADQINWVRPDDNHAWDWQGGIDTCSIEEACEPHGMCPRWLSSVKTGTLRRRRNGGVSEYTRAAIFDKLLLALGKQGDIHYITEYRMRHRRGETVYEAIDYDGRLDE